MSAALAQSSDTMNGAVSAAELGRQLWRDKSGAEAYLVLSEVLGHLDLLEASGRVRALDDGGIVRWERDGQPDE